MIQTKAKKTTTLSTVSWSKEVPHSARAHVQTSQTCREYLALGPTAMFLSSFI